MPTHNNDTHFFPKCAEAGPAAAWLQIGEGGVHSTVAPEGQNTTTFHEITTKCYMSENRITFKKKTTRQFLKDDNFL